MIVQYAMANARSGLVTDTDHTAQSLMGFLTKFGDGGADMLPLAGLSKRPMRALAAPAALMEKTPADRETLRPQHPAEDADGTGYDKIDDFLESNARINCAAQALRHRTAPRLP